MTSSVGELWVESVNPAAPFGLFRINPGRTGTITVTITVPSAATAGTVVSGDVYVDTFVPFVQAAGSATPAIPYAYTVSSPRLQQAPNATCPGAGRLLRA